MTTSVQEQREYVIIIFSKTKVFFNEGDFGLIFRKFAISSHNVEDNQLLKANDKRVRTFLSKSHFTLKEMREIASDICYMLKNLEINVLERESYYTPKKLAVFDMDSTLIKQEMIDEISKFTPHQDEIISLTKSSMNGELNFQESLKRRVSLLKGLSSTIFNNIKEKIEFTEGAVEIIQLMKSLGMHTAVISGGFMQFAEFAKEKLGLNYAFANTLEISSDGFLTGSLIGNIVDKNEKENILKQLCLQNDLQLEQTIAVGDGDNDIHMINAAGIGIAWNAKPIVQKNSPFRLNTTSLMDIQYFFECPH